MIAKYISQYSINKGSKPNESCSLTEICQGVCLSAHN